jgi:xanthine dehydrogenase iron-sulfur cluster and FAD-binding subunit A
MAVEAPEAIAAELGVADFDPLLARRTRPAAALTAAVARAQVPQKVRYGPKPSGAGTA